MGMAEEIEKLNALRESGAITAAEYEQAKATVLAGKPAPGQQLQATLDGISPNAWALAIHLTQYLGYPAPIAGWIVPILIWQLKKDASPEIDRHGRIVANWMITQLIVVGCCFLLTVTVIGIPVAVMLGIVLGVAALVFPIIGAVKANEGEVWPYPFSIAIFPVDRA
jgi:uncharacterized Tic20 family protein